MRSSIGKIAAGVDVKAGRALCTVPPTSSYSWITPLVSLADLPPPPAWLIPLVSPPPTIIYPRGIEPLRGTGAYTRAVLERELNNVATCSKGGRNDALFRASVRLGELAGAAMISRETVAHGLLAAAIECGLVRDDGQRGVENTIASGLRRGMSNPRCLEIGGRRHAR